MSYYNYGRRYIRSRARINLYYILQGGALIGTSMGDNSRAALMAFCRLAGIPFIDGNTYGACGLPAMMCCANAYGMRPCGARGKCQPIYGLPTAGGLIVATPAR